MIDFTEMEYGVIKCKKGVIIIINGVFHEPLNKRQLGELIEMWKSALALRKG